jgi:hypothetical protein
MSVLGLVGGAEDDDGAQGTFGERPKPVPIRSEGSVPAANGHSHHDDTLWEPTEKPKKSDTVSQAQMTRLTILGADVYGKEFETQSGKLAEWVSKGSVTELRQLSAKEGDVLIRALEKKLTEKVPA